MLRHLLRTVNLFDTATRALFLCFLAACHAKSGGGNELRGLVYYESNDPRSLDPALSTDVPTGEMVSLLFDGLTQFDPDGTLLPGLSDRWTADKRAQRYVFHLRSGVTFHDGHPFVAADVKRSFLRVLNPATHGGRVWPLLPIAGAQDYADGRALGVRGIDLLGDSAVVFTLTQPLAVFPKLLAMPVAAIVPSSLSPDFGQRPIGTGPWRFVAWEHDDYLRFARNPSYWGGAPRAESLTVRIVPEPLTRAAEFLAGRLSVAEIPFGETMKWEHEHADWLHRKAALRAAGYPDGFAVQLWRSGTNVELGRVAQALQAQLSAVGIRVEIVSRDASSMREAARNGETDMALLDWWADYPDADNFLYPLFHSASFGPGGNVSFFGDPVTDSLILTARRTVDQPAREALYRRIETRVFRAAPWIYLWFPIDLWAAQPSLDGWDVPVIFNGQRWIKAHPQ